MLRTGLKVIVVSVLLNASVYANVIQLNPKESKSLTNPYMWTLKATCNVQGGMSKTKILVSVVQNKGSVNGKSLTKGHAAAINVKNNAKISVSAEPGTTVNIVNLGGDSVRAVCVA